MRISNAIAAALFAVALVPARGSACGGLFCNAAQPVVQSAERIVFVDHGNGTMSMMVEILYSGPSQSFAWVLPVGGVPQISVGSTAALRVLDNATRPVFQLLASGDVCSVPFPTGAVSDYFADASTDAGVTVQAEGSVGPYDYVIISVDPLLPSPADAGKEWLIAHGYDVSSVGASTLGAYLRGGQNLLAFRLTKNATTGSIRPVIMTYSSNVPVIPIRPTALAAQNDMGVLVFLYGATRAVPTSYDEIVIPDEALSWSNPYASYLGLVRTAVDSAGGHAFITERAGRAPTVDANGSGLRASLDAVSAVSTGDGDTVQTALNAFATAEGLPDVIARSGITFRYAGTTDPVPYSTALSCVFCGIYEKVVPATFDRAAFLADLLAFVVKPVEDSEALLAERPYMTRLYTTLDPVEMDVDPVFTFATGLPEVSGFHTATLVSSCSAGGTFTYTLFSSGRSVSGAVAPTGVPQILTWTNYDSSGVPTVVQDNASAVIANTLATPPTPPVVRDGRTRSPDHLAGGCAIVAARASSRDIVWPGVVLLGLVLARRRRDGRIAA